MLDGIEDRGSPVAADSTLAYLRKALRWYATRDDTFVVPIVPGMARTKPKERARTRILSDDEIRDLYAALDAIGNDAPKCFPAFVRALLLTAQRLRMVSNLPWSEIEGNEWTVPPERNKSGLDHLVPLTRRGSRIAGASGARASCFPTMAAKRRSRVFQKASSLGSQTCRDMKAAGRKPIPRFTFHDLRRPRAV